MKRPKPKKGTNKKPIQNRRNWNRNTDMREEATKDSDSKRVNYDNARVSRIEKDMTDKSNDPKWYANSPELLRSAASLPFSPVTGRNLEFNASASVGGTPNSVPGILAMYWSPAIPTNYGNAIDQAANSIYSYTVHANSRTTKYDAPDELLLIIAGAQLFSALAFGIRAYGIMRRYYQQESYTPNGLLSAMGFDPQDLQSNYSKMWFQLNELIARSQQIWIPNTMPVIERWFWMNSNMYRDGDSVKAQYYLYVPTVFYQLVETDPSGTMLQPIQWYTPNNYATLNTTVSTPITTRWGVQIPQTSASTGQLRTWNDYITIVNQLFSSLLNSQDRGIIFGDILKAYGADRLYSVSSLNVDYTVEPVYDREVLTQIENLSTFAFEPGNIKQTENGHLYQMFDKPVGNPGWRQNTSCTFSGPRQQVLNFHQREVPSPEQIMVATRMKTMGIAVNQLVSGGSAYAPATCGTEVCTGLVMVSNIWNNNVPTLCMTYFSQYFGSWSEINSTGNEIKFSMEIGGNIVWMLTQYLAFDWAPWIYRIAPFEWGKTPNDGASATIYDQTVYTYGDWDNYTVIDEELLNKLNITAIYSEYGVPSVI